MITSPGGGCCTVFPFEAAIWLLEEQEELVGTNKRSINRCLPFQSWRQRELLRIGSLTHAIHFCGGLLPRLAVATCLAHYTLQHIVASKTSNNVLQHITAKQQQQQTMVASYSKEKCCPMQHHSYDQHY